MDPISFQSTGGLKWRIGTFFGNTIFVQPAFIVLIAFISLAGANSYNALVGGLILCPLLMFSIIFHELGHALTTKFFGYGNSTIILHAFGGVSIRESNSLAAPLKKGLISAAGPISSGLLALIGYIAFQLFTPTLLSSMGSWGAIAVQVIYSFFILNLIFAIFNALPIIPLDGGHVTMHLIENATGSEYKGLKYTAYISIGTLLLTAIPIWKFYNGGFLTFFILGLLIYQNFTIIRKL